MDRQRESIAPNGLCIIRKTRRYIALVRIGKLKSAVDIMEIERRLLEHLSSNAPDPK